MSRVLLIDDDAELGKLVTQFLAGEGFDVDCAVTGQQGLHLAVANPYALIMLDVMLPDIGGFEVLRRLRAQSDTPILMLTARGETHDLVTGLDLGADDYLAKPYDPAELAARSRALVRRAGKSRGKGMVLVVGDLCLNGQARSVTVGGKPVALTSVEFDLLATLLRSAGTVIRREDLVRTVLEREFSAYDRSLDTHISNLRRKLGQDGSGRIERIKAIRGTGYLYAKSVS